MWYSDQWQKTSRQFNEIWLSGFTNATPANVGSELSALAKSWQNAPTMTADSATGAVGYGYDIGQRAYLLDFESVTQLSTAIIQINASSDSPLINPTFLINNYGMDTPKIRINGQLAGPGPDFRHGYYSTLDIEDGRQWQDVLIIWLKGEWYNPVQIKIFESDVSMEQVILILKMITGHTVDLTIVENLDGDLVIGLSDAIIMLQQIGGIR
ncbi:MAG: hypothetical protein OMM_05235 [Candidatus Magnetoglobus multicellularis str. Araruama]|uniref:Uncharacterized protein n=1 Tax=Candidatus Magnetoglobus multicellularis str. Araruama TaxID=890399 RepID=A0A1V1NXF5_9BACT|nr:MAG: hypothetical protein OMM_05235 [Candidatus Magnetoglobus multicellularis str. Araruama]